MSTLDRVAEMPVLGLPTYFAGVFDGMDYTADIDDHLRIAGGKRGSCVVYAGEDERETGRGKFDNFPG